MASGGGGVRNLRAMFENKTDDTVPSERGGSPALSGRSGSIPPVPLNKVRTSFIAVERSGQFGPQLGLRRDTSGSESSAADLRGVSSERRESSRSRQFQANSDAVADTIKNNFLNRKISETSERKLDTSIEVDRGRKPDPSPTTSSLAALPTTKNEVKELQNGGATKEASKLVPARADGKDKATPGKSTVPSNSKPAPTQKTTTPLAKGSSAASPKSAASKPTASPNPAPTMSKPSTSKLSVPEPSKAPVRKPSRVSLAASTRTTNPSTTSPSAATKKPVTGTRSSTGFVKPKPRSPTRPVKLPASLMASTTSSQSKTSSTTPSTATSTAGSSRLSTGAVTTKASTVDPTKPRRMASTKTTDRPSLGRPSTSSTERPRSRVSTAAAPDDSFLARMMRPTASSVQKTHEKVVTPPRKSPGRQTARSTTPNSKGSPVAKKSSRPVKPLSQDVPPLPSIPPTIAVEEDEAIPSKPAIIEEADIAVPEKVDAGANAIMEKLPVEAAPEVTEQEAQDETSATEPFSATGLADAVESKESDEVLAEMQAEEPLKEEIVESTNAEPSVLEAVPVQEPTDSNVEDTETVEDKLSVEELLDNEPANVTDEPKIPDAPANEIQTVEALSSEADIVLDAESSTAEQNTPNSPETPLEMPDEDSKVADEVPNSVSESSEETPEELDSGANPEVSDILTESENKLNVVAQEETKPSEDAKTENDVHSVPVSESS